MSGVSVRSERRSSVCKKGSHLLADPNIQSPHIFRRPVQTDSKEREKETLHG